MSICVASVDIKVFTNAHVVFLYLTDRPNGDEELVGTFDPNDTRPVKIGSLKLTEAKSNEEARQLQREYLKKYPPGRCLDDKGWRWGEVDHAATQKYHASKPKKYFVTIHHVIKGQ